jgi:hypothetical protein
MLAYVYQADLYCEDCATQIKAELAYSHEGQPEHLFDSDEYPKGPYPAGESDTPDHCGNCGVFLENSLTGDGEQYVKDAIQDGTGDPEVLATWKEFYSYLFTEEED